MFQVAFVAPKSRLDVLNDVIDYLDKHGRTIGFGVTRLDKALVLRDTSLLSFNATQNYDLMFLHLRNEIAIAHELKQSKSREDENAKRALKLLESVKRLEDLPQPKGSLPWLVDTIQLQTHVSLRTSMLRMIEKITTCVNEKHDSLLAPKSFEIANGNTDLLPANARYPLLAKPQSGENHQISVVFNRADMLAFLKEHKNTTVVTQVYSPHDSYMVKLFSIDGHATPVYRTSIPKFAVGESDKPRFDFVTLDYCGKVLDSEEVSRVTKMPEHLIDTISSVAKKVLGACMLEMDVIFDVDQKRWVIVDLNHFPSYNGAPREWIKQRMLDFITQYIK